MASGAGGWASHHSWRPPTCAGTPPVDGLFGEEEFIRTIGEKEVIHTIGEEEIIRTIGEERIREILAQMEQNRTPNGSGKKDR